ncbi:hypothetical protein TrCOL_g10381 [Triparma columacea]|uniref:Uncharacterized protein n=1 Tax=Triparma columacea TaxID=722753 RepID=A0A9W7FWV2_9STRA|nr:hypothetical protein TrCOL_g10381 [Triparma columacea]
MEGLPPPPPRAQDTTVSPPVPPEAESTSILSFGGPGWIADVFDVQVDFDNDVLVRDKGQKFTVPFTSCREAIPMYRPGDVVSGFITVKSPPGFEVTANMITVKAEEYVCLLDPYVTNDMKSVKQIVSPSPVLIGGEQTFRFELDLSCSVVVDPEGVPPTMPVELCSAEEDYIGTQFAIKHALVVEIQRPWWTFDVNFHEPFAVYDNTKPAPAKSVGRKQMSENDLEQIILTEVQASYLDDDDERDEDEIRETCTKLYEEGLKVESHVLQVSDFPAEFCSFNYGCDSVNMDEGIIGVLTIRNSRVDVNHLQLSFYKNESIDGVLWETVLNVIEIGNDGLTRKGEKCQTPFTPAFEEKQIRIGFEGFKTQTSKPVELDVEDEGAFISPTLSKRSSGTGRSLHKHTMSVEYFIRLSITAADECNYWDTNEVFVHRQRLPEGAAKKDSVTEGGGSGV